MLVITEPRVTVDRVGMRCYKHDHVGISGTRKINHKLGRIITPLPCRLVGNNIEWDVDGPKASIIRIIVEEQLVYDSKVGDEID